ncbi:MAG: ROK family glucokinase [Nocardioidaceae bacterium]|nr:ROK family glucokinase [Nocardioidaceae bacterium]
MAEKLAIGIDIGGTKVKAGVVDLDGHVVQRVRRETPTTSPSAVLNTIADIVSELRAQHHVISVGIGAAGFVDSTRSTVLFSPHLAWRHEPLRDAVRRRIGLSVIVDNDANAAAWAEWKFGAAQNEDHLVCITLGTGIGGALVISGQLHRGRYGLAGEFGHMQVVPDGHPCECGNRGCWEQYASGNVLIREAQSAARAGSPLGLRLLELTHGDLDAVDGRAVTEAARAGDQDAVRLLADVGRWLGVGIANLAAAFDPGIFVVGGGVSDADDLLLDPARDAFRQGLTGRGFRPEAQVVRAHLGNDAGMIGAADMSRALRRRPRRTRSDRRAALAERPRRAAREPGTTASLFAVRRDR